MITAAAVLPAIGFRLPAIEAFPTSLSVLNLAGLDHDLDSENTFELRSLLDEFVRNVHVEKFLRARGNKAFDEGFAQSYRVVLDYYAESSAIICRGLNHDYYKLMRLSRVSGEKLERVFFDHVSKLKPQTFIASVARLRVLAKVAEWGHHRRGRQESGQSSCGLLEQDRSRDVPRLVPCGIPYRPG